MRTLLAAWMAISSTILLSFGTDGKGSEPEGTTGQRLPPDSIAVLIAVSAESGIGSLHSLSQIATVVQSLENDPRFRATGPFRARATYAPLPTSTGVSLLKLEFSSASRHAETLKEELEGIAREHQSVLKDLTHFARLPLQQRVASEKEKIERLEKSLEAVDQEHLATKSALDILNAREQEFESLARNIRSSEESMQVLRASRREIESTLAEERKAIEELERRADSVSVETKRALDPDFSRTREALSTAKESVNARQSKGGKAADAEKREIERLTKLEEHASRQRELLREIQSRRPILEDLKQQLRNANRELTLSEGRFAIWNQQRTALPEAETAKKDALYLSLQLQERRHAHLLRLLEARREAMIDAENRLEKLFEPKVEILRFQVNDGTGRP